MSLNKVKPGSQMYQWITHTWNTVKGSCYHDCSYCYMKRWGKLKSVHFDEKELKSDLETGNFIFVGSSCDMFAQDIPNEWIVKTLEHCGKYEYNKYLFQTKNPKNIRRILTYESRICVTLETNRHYPEIMRNSPKPIERVDEMCFIRHPLYITIEPIMDFDLFEFVNMIKFCDPVQVNIGANTSYKIQLREPPKEKILQLIEELQKYTIVKQKSNLKRLL
jgi:DNA repair photolyase